MQDELILNEYDNLSDVVIGKCIDSLILSGSIGISVAVNEFEHHLEQIEGIERIHVLRIERDSQLTNLQFVKVMPNLDTIFLYGGKLESIYGLEHLRMVKFIEIDFGNKKKRSLSALRKARVIKLSVWSPSSKDIENISHSSTINDLEIFKCKEILHLELLIGLPLKNLRLEKFALEELGDFKQLSQLESLLLINCKNFRQFRGINNSLEVLIIEDCNNIDLMSIHVFSTLKSLDLIGIKQIVSLSAFAGLNKLTTLSIQNCQVDVDNINLKSNLPLLEELWVSGIKRPQVVELSKNNLDVVVSNGVYTYRNCSKIDTNNYE